MKLLSGSVRLVLEFYNLDFSKNESNFRSFGSIVTISNIGNVSEEQ